MIIHKAEQWAYLGPPKTASTAMHFMLQQEPWCGEMPNPDNQHDMLVPDECIDFFVFATIRDPYERAMSLYWHYLRDVRRIRGLMDGQTREQFTKNPLPETEFPFRDYMKAVLENRLRVIDDPGAPFFTFTLSDWLHDAMPLDAYVHQENLSEELVRLTPFGERKIVVPRKNAPGRKPWSEFKTEGTIALVDAWAEEDFRRFGYESQAGTV